MKQKMIQNLLGVIKQLQNHLLKQHQDISQQLFSCQNCDQYKIKQDLVQKELTLLHHELERMSQNRSRRISISGIPSERIYNLATRTYDVCAEHREMHLRSRNRRSVCQHPEETVDSDDSDENIEGPLMVTAVLQFSYLICYKILLSYIFFLDILFVASYVTCVSSILFIYAVI